MRALPFTAPEIRVVRRPSMAAFEALVAEELPFVLDGCMDDWPLYRRLRATPTVEEKMKLLAEGMEETKVEYAAWAAEHQGHLYFAKGVGTQVRELVQQTPFSVFSKRFLAAHNTGAETIYMQQMSVRRLPRWNRQIEVLPYLIDGALVNSSAFWLGSGGQVVDLHHDIFNNFICMLEGEKRVLAAPFEVLHDIYPRPLDRTPYGAVTSSAKLLEPDFQTFPRLRQAIEKLQVTVLREGQILYLPPYWWHHVESFGFNMMVNIFWFDTDPKVAHKIMALHRRALTMFPQYSDEIRNAYRAPYLAAFAGKGEVVEVADPSLRRSALDAHLKKTREIMPRASRIMRKAEESYYDHWVFRSLGDPLETYPGEFPRMIERIRAVERGRRIKRFFALRIAQQPARIRKGALLH